MTIGQLKDLQEEFGLDDDTLLIARINDDLSYFYEDAEVEPVNFDSTGLMVDRRAGVDAIIMVVDN